MARLVQFLTSAADSLGFPPESVPEFAFAGRSNVGKSTLLNALVGKPIARTSRTPGRTRLINWFAVGEGRNQVNYVDLPGYGFAEVDRKTRAAWQPLIEQYLLERKTLAAVLLLIDIRRGAASEEHAFVAWLHEHKLPVWLVATKADQLPKHKRSLAIAAMRRELGVSRDPFAVSVDDSASILALARVLKAST